MTYLVAVCDSCQSVSLALAPQLQRPVRSCERCQEPLRVVPSRAFHDNERTIFHLLSDAVGAGSLSSVEASALGRLINRALVERTYTACWDTLTNRLPALISWEQVLGGNEHAHSNVLLIVRTILDALATCRSSGFLPAVKPEAAGVRKALPPERASRPKTPKSG